MWNVSRAMETAPQAVVCGLNSLCDDHPERFVRLEFRYRLSLNREVRQRKPSAKNRRSSKALTRSFHFGVPARLQYTPIPANDLQGRSA